MGKPDLFAKRTFATQTATITGGGASWKDAPEIGLEHVQSDGILIIHDLIALQKLAPPWSLVHEIDEILLEFKMQGDHIDRLAVARTLLRRQVREVQRLEEMQREKNSWMGSQTLWLASAYVPDWVVDRDRPECLEPGCHRFRGEGFTALWIASNELPLRDELVPFLITRTGNALREFLHWMLEKKSWPLLWELLSSLRMVPQDFLRKEYIAGDEEEQNHIRSLVLGFLEGVPSLEEEITRKAVEATALRDARDAVKRTLRVRKFDVRPEHLAKVDACMNLDMLYQWHDRAVTAASVDEALGVE